MTDLSAITADLQAGRYTQAITEISSLLKTRLPSRTAAQLWNFLGFAYEQTRQFTDARQCYQQAIEITPDSAEYHNNLGILWAKLGNLQEAQLCFEQVLQRKPDAQSHLTLAQLCLQRHQLSKSLALTAQAHLLDSKWSAPIEHLFQLMESMAYQDNIFSDLQQQFNETGHSFYQIAMGAYYQALGDTKTAQKHLRQVLDKSESYGLLHYHLINSLHNDYRYTEALRWALQFYEATPSLANARTIISSLQEPIVFSQAHIAEIAEHLERYLDYFIKHHVQAPSHYREISVAQNLNFYHCYQLKAFRPLQKKLAQFYGLPQVVPPPAHPTEASRKPRLGILSHHFYNQSVMHLLQRALEHLMQSQHFEVFVFFCQGENHTREDHITERVRSQSDHFEVLPTHPMRAIHQVHQAQLDILIYPEIGMNAFVYVMASQRLARFQMVMSGHPVTTGLPHMDYFVSSQILETEHGQSHYSEKLITLPGLPDYAPVTVPPRASRQVLGLPESGSLYFCPMTLFKIHPDFDAVLKQILEKDAQGHVLFLAYNDLELRLQQRFHQSLGEALLPRIHFLPWSNRETFYQRLMACDVILDSFYFGGGNTSYQALGLGCPIVTLDLPWNRSRWTQTMYQLMDFTALIAKDPAHYAELAVSVATNSTWNQELRQTLQRKSTVLFDNPTWSESLLQFCQTLLHT